MIKITGLKLKQLRTFAAFCSRFGLSFPESDWQDIEMVEESTHMNVNMDDLVDVYIINNNLTWYPVFITIPDRPINRIINYNQFMYNLKSDYKDTMEEMLNGSTDEEDN